MKTDTSLPPSDPVLRSDATATRRPQHAIYKPNSRGTGGVVRFELNGYKEAVFVDAAPQSGDRQFDWEAKLTMKWGLSDLGAALSVFQGRQPAAKLFHRSEKSNSACEIVARDDADRSPFLFSLSRQEEDKSVRKIAIPVTHAEAAILEVVLGRAVETLAGW
ncbi:hypothetical protein [Haloferula sargassicola]|uniref:Uncharacterized protein n=1 Tax=Haloferula sargassicola TaxID=490096 RepID=A0ABP9UKL0_9BACT